MFLITGFNPTVKKKCTVHNIGIYTKPIPSLFVLFCFVVGIKKVYVVID